MDIKYYTLFARGTTYWRLSIPENQQNGGGPEWVKLPEGVHTVQVVGLPTDAPLYVRFKLPGAENNDYIELATIPAASTGAVSVTVPPGGGLVCLWMGRAPTAEDTLEKRRWAGMTVFLGTNEPTA